MTGMGKHDSFKPAVTRSVLLLLAGLAWFSVGGMLLSVAYGWVSAIPWRGTGIFSGIGIILALAVHHFGFLKIVDRNIARILPMVEKRCLFAFITWKSYLIIMVMVAMGSFLRHSTIPKRYLAVVYIGMGLALVLSSLRYLRVFISEVRKSSD